MKPLIYMTFFLVALVAGCTDTETYPLSGEECGPDDPVKDISVPDCPPL